MKPIIEVNNISKKYSRPTLAQYKSIRESVSNLFNFKKAKNDKQSFWALRDISFSVSPGEVLGVIGRNGAGKSTLLKILSRITYPTEGSVTLRGRVASLLEVGTGFHPELTGRENIYLNGAILGMKQKEIKKRFADIVNFAEIHKFLDMPVKHYSSGMYMRLAFAVAAHLDHEILLIDEVLAVGDIAFQKKCLGKMNEVKSQGRTILFVSHNVTAIKALCTRALLLKDGRVVSEGNTEKVINTYITHERKYVFSRFWRKRETAPQNTSFVIKKVSICDAKGRVANHLDTDSQFQFEILHEVKKEKARVGITVIIYDRNGSCIFSSVNNHEKSWYGKPMPKGAYRSTCVVPAFLLNSGTFRMQLNLFGSNFSDEYKTGDILMFEIEDGKYVRGDYFGQYDGAVRPFLHWETIKM